MAHEFPEITSFGTLLRFALALEGAAGELAATAAARADCRVWQESLARCARKHERRAAQLERLRRERLNEVVLQPLSGLRGADYLPASELPDDPEEAVVVIARIEERVASFYADAAGAAHRVLGGLERTFRKLAADSTALATALHPGMDG
jgi:hypothetical protein